MLSDEQIGKMRNRPKLGNPFWKLTRQDRLDLAEWVRSNLPEPRLKNWDDWEKHYNWGYNTALDDCKQTLLADLEADVNPTPENNN